MTIRQSFAALAAAGIVCIAFTVPSLAGVPLKMSATQPPDNPNCLAVKMIKSLVDQRAPGKFDAEAICGLALGSDVEVARQVRAGVLQFATNSSANLSNIAPAFAILDLPFMFRDAAEAEAVLSGPFADELLATLPPKGLQGLAIIPAGFRQIFNSKRPVRTMEDLKGLKMRSTRSKIDIAATKALGINPTPLAFAEVYSAIQTDVVEGVLVPSVLGYSMRFHEVSPYHSVLNLQALAFIWFVNRDWYNSLPGELRKVLLQAAKEARQFEVDELSRQTPQSLKKMKAEGGTVITVSEDAKAPMLKAVQPVWRKFKGEIPPEFYDKIEAAKAAVRK